MQGTSWELKGVSELAERQANKFCCCRRSPPCPFPAAPYSRKPQPAATTRPTSHHRIRLIRAAHPARLVFLSPLVNRREKNTSLPQEPGTALSRISPLHSSSPERRASAGPPALKYRAF